MSLHDYLKLEENEHNAYIAQRRRGHDAEVDRVTQEVMRRGHGSASPAVYLATLRLRIPYLIDIISNRILLRERYGVDCPELLSQYYVDSLEHELLQTVEVSQMADRGTFERRSRAANVEAPPITQREISAYSEASEHVRREINRIRLKHKLGHYKPETPAMTVNINHSTIANLNLGNQQVGDINTTITQLSGQGHEDLATSIKALIEQVAELQALSTEDRHDVIENLQTVAEQAALPPENRRVSTVRTLLSGIATTLQTAAAGSDLWGTHGKAILTFFGLA